MFSSGVLPCVIFEDEHLLVVNKPAGLNTHAPSPFAGEGIYDWLRHREPRWGTLAIIHRLDKETSGVLVFSKTPLANRSLTEQFARHTVRKKYLLLTDRPVRRKEFVVKTSLVRAGEKYVSRPLHAGGQLAETRFRELVGADVRRLISNAEGGIRNAGKNPEPRYLGSYNLVEAEPLTGRTHQIRVHAAELGFPVLGDTLYGGTPAPRVFLHAAELVFKHPATGEEARFRSPADFDADARFALREALIDCEATDAFRLIHGVSDGWPGWYVDRLGDFLLSQTEPPLRDEQKEFLKALMRSAKAFGVPASAGKPDRLTRKFHTRLEWPAACSRNLQVAIAGRPWAARRKLKFAATACEISGLKAGLQTGAYHKILTRQVRRTSATEASPQLVLGQAAPERFTIRENGVRFELSFKEGYSVGLFLDQRDNRRRFLTGHVAAGFPLTSAGRVPRGSNSAHSTNSGTRGARPSGTGLAGLQILNTFAYTCGFSVCAARAGAKTTSLDLSKKHLEWGKRNFALNGLDPAAHDFICGDVFDWLRRLTKKGGLFDAIVLDPPTFSQSKEGGVFRAEKDYGKLVKAALPLLKSGGVLFASTNAADWQPTEFLASVQAPIRSAGRKISQQYYVPQPPDFPITRAEPGCLKTVWLRIF